MHVATDWEDYAVQIREAFAADSAFEDAAQEFASRPETKFERRGARLGHRVWDVVFRRR